MAEQSSFEFLPASLRRKLNRRICINRVLYADEQGNSGAVNLHRLDPSNAGDFYCGPHHYFEPLKGTALDLFDYQVPEKDKRDHWTDAIVSHSLIIGGGGLLNYHGFSKQMKMFEALGSKGKKMVIWGAGHNTPRTRNVNRYSIDTKQFGLVGTRDYSMPNEWVPCVSCMHPIFDTKGEVKHDLGIFLHKKNLNNPALLNKVKDLPQRSNQDSFEDIINFLKSCETVVTDSYHGMYWSILLGKKVISVPTTSKFYDFKYKTPMTDMDSFDKVLAQASSYTGVLEECREINLKFADKVFDYLNL